MESRSALLVSAGIFAAVRVVQSRALTTVPWGLRKTLVYIHKHYTKTSGIPIWITENGFPVDGEAEMPLEERIEDTPRQEYYAGYLKAMMEAIQIDGVKMGGYMAWSLLE